jgi:flagellar biosynthesis/type III secretory pathway protein FliH
MSFESCGLIPPPTFNPTAEQIRSLQQAAICQTYPAYSTSPLSPSVQSLTSQEMNRLIESSREEGRRAGYGEGYEKGFNTAIERLERKASDRLDCIIDVFDCAREIAEEKADAADCYDGEKVRFSWKFHATQLKKLLETARKL